MAQSLQEHAREQANAQWLQLQREEEQRPHRLPEPQVTFNDVIVSMQRRNLNLLQAKVEVSRKRRERRGN
jgi:hypothetical protein